MKRGLSRYHEVILFLAAMGVVLGLMAPASVMALVLDRIGLALSERYAELDSFDGRGLWDEIFASLVFLNEVWRAYIVVGRTEAYWSLSFEATSRLAQYPSAQCSGAWRC
jgi:hypothetical protein